MEDANSTDEGKNLDDNTSIDDNDVTADIVQSVNDCEESNKKADYHNWRDNLKKIPCCHYVETVLKSYYKRNGGSGVTGEGGTDGTGSVYQTHQLLTLLKTLRILVENCSFTDLGSGSGLLLTHVALFDNLGIKCIGVECIKSRVTDSIIQLRKLDSDQFDNANVYLQMPDV